MPCQLLANQRTTLLGKMVFGSAMPRPARCSASVSEQLRVVLLERAWVI
jgi:hypothetical protein